MRKVIAYRLIDAENISKLQEMLGEGWQPWGSPLTNGESFMYQAMVQYEEEKKEGKEGTDPSESGIVPEQLEDAFEDMEPEGIGAS